MVKKVCSFRLDEGLLGRVDAAVAKRGGRRNDFVTDALEAFLSGGVLPVAPPKPKSKGALVSIDVDKSRADLPALSADENAILDLCEGRRLTSRQAESELNWLGLRFYKSERALMKMGLLRVSDGILTVVHRAE